MTSKLVVLSLSCIVATRVVQGVRVIKTSGEELDPSKRVDVDAPHAAGWLGWGRWVAKQDLWHMTALSGESLFARNMPGSCFKEQSCRSVTSFKSKSFESVSSWSSYYSSSFGMGVTGGYKGFTGSIDASMGTSIGTSGNVSRRVFYATTTAQRKCFRLVRDKFCAYNMSHLQPAVLSRLTALPTGSPYDSAKMEAWKVSFIQRFGTHMAMSSSHGARVQSLASVDSRAEVSSACVTQSMCGSFGWVAAGDVNFCSNSSSCDNTTDSFSSQKNQCVAIGGDTTLQLQVCQAKPSAETVNAWLGGGNVETGSTAYEFSFMPISEFLTNVDFDKFYDASETLAKAVEYSNCRIGMTPPIEAWRNSRCECVRKCENGGTLDPATCTCKCQGNPKHGFTGPTCTQEYGKCQPGPGSGNPDASRKCPIANRCASWFQGHTCRASEVCCATNFNTRCCPFGSTCRCDSGGCTCGASLAAVATNTTG